MKYLLLCAVLAPIVFGQAKALVNGPEYRGPDGRVHRIQADLPASEHIRNTRGRNGAGLCVWTSLGLAGKYQGAPELLEILDWMHSQPGGGTPGRVAKVVSERAPKVTIAQHQGSDKEWLIWCLKTRRKLSITNGYDPTLYRGTVSHMVNWDYIGGDTVAVQDNNAPGEWRWMTFDEAYRRAMHPRGSYWAFAIVDPPPPPPLLRE